MNADSRDQGPLEDRCTRVGWALGWIVALWFGLSGAFAGGAYEMAAIRALLALLVFPLLGWLTGILLTRVAPEEPEASAEAEPAAEETGLEQEAKGTQVDLTVGDEEAWPEPGPERPEPERVRETSAA